MVGFYTFIRSNWRVPISIVQYKHRDDRMWIKVAKSISRLERDLYIGFFYVPQKGLLANGRILTQSVYAVFSPRRCITIG